MLFNSYYFILIFLPLVAAGYFLIAKYRPPVWSRTFLLLASLFFVSYWNIYFAVALMSSAVFNFLCGTALSITAERHPARKKPLFIFAVAANVLYLGFFKYTNFFLDSINTAFSTSIGSLSILLPLGISYYTFMQIAWLTDIYRRGGCRYDFLSYCLYVTFFPYVVSGPIAYHSEIIPQFQTATAGKLNLANVSAGLFMFTIGLFKKTAIADTLAVISDGGHAASILTFTEAWLTSLSYTLQLYFDFSGYTDMAIGAALLFNIRLPINFDSPYKALNIKEFWQRWHMTLSRFLLNYVYVPMGGNRKGEARTLFNILVLFLICGLWHGSAWTFVLWGFVTGLASIVYRLWAKTGRHLPKPLAWFLYFNFFNFSVVFFRAETVHDAFKVLKGMAGLNGIIVSPHLATSPFWQSLTVIGIRFGEWRANLPQTETPVYFFCLLLIPFILLTKNSNQLLAKFSPNWKTALATSLLLIAGLLLLNESSSFLYFNF